MKELAEVVKIETWHKLAIQRLLSKLWDQTPYITVLSRILNRELVLWETKAKLGLVITEVLVHPRGKELFVFGITGAGILPKRDAILEDIMEMAAENNCKFLGASAIREGSNWLGKTLGFTPVATRYIKEL